MATIKDNLKRIVTALGGTSTENTIKGVIGEIADNASGGDVMLVNSVYDEEQEVFILDKMFGEIRNAFDSGTTIIISSPADVDKKNLVIGVQRERIGDGSDTDRYIGTISASYLDYQAWVSAGGTLDDLDSIYPQAS